MAGKARLSPFFGEHGMSFPIMRCFRPQRVTGIAVGVVLLVLLSSLVWRCYFYIAQGRAIAAMESQGALVSQASDTQSTLENVVGFLCKPRYVSISVYATRADLSRTHDLPGVISLELHDTTIDDRDAQAISEMLQLESLSMVRVRVPGSLWPGLARLETLRWLFLKDIDVSDGGVSEIATMRGLTRLHLDNCGVTDRGLGDLQGLPALRELNLRGSRLSALGLRHLPSLPELQEADLADCGLTDESLNALLPCKSLSSLDVSGNPIADDGLRILSQMQNLGHIRLNRTRITDAGLRAFGEQPTRGRHLEVKGTAITESGIVKLRALNPGMTIETN
jgi:hypothetical protein